MDDVRGKCREYGKLGERYVYCRNRPHEPTSNS